MAKQLPIRIGDVTKDNFNQVHRADDAHGIRLLILMRTPGAVKTCASAHVSAALRLHFCLASVWFCRCWCWCFQLRKLNQVVFPVSYSEQFYANIQKPEVTPITKLGQRHARDATQDSLARLGTRTSHLLLLLGRLIVLRSLLCVACTPAWHNDVVVGGVCCRFEAVAAPASASAADTDDKNNKASEVSHSAQAQNRIYIMTLGVLAPYRGRGIGRRAKIDIASRSCALPLIWLSRFLRYGRLTHSCTRVAFGFSVDFSRRQAAAPDPRIRRVALGHC